MLGNSLAILTGIADRERAGRLIDYVETNCASLRENGDLLGQLPPASSRICGPVTTVWRPRCRLYNRPGEYHQRRSLAVRVRLLRRGLRLRGAPRTRAPKAGSAGRLVKPWHEDEYVGLQRTSARANRQADRT